VGRARAVPATWSAAKAPRRPHWIPPLKRRSVHGWTIRKTVPCNMPHQYPRACEAAHSAEEILYPGAAAFASSSLRKGRARGKRRPQPLGDRVTGTTRPPAASTASGSASAKPARPCRASAPMNLSMASRPTCSAITGAPAPSREKAKEELTYIAARDRWFESGFLQRRGYCEPDDGARHFPESCLAPAGLAGCLFIRRSFLLVDPVAVMLVSSK
jgi:hypothetical protein